MAVMTPDEVRSYLGDGNMGGRSRRSDEETASLWAVGVEETRAELEGPWG
jgi:creatinine amidohydrolase